MNTTSRTLLSTVVIAVIGAASLVLGAAPEAADASRQEIVKLERVVIEGRRTPEVRTAAVKVERLPTVVIEGRRDNGVTQVARANCKTETVVC